MGVNYPHRRIKVGFSADPDPNATEPDPRAVMHLVQRPAFGNTLTKSHSLYLTFEAADGVTDVAGGEITFVTWERDETTKKWVQFNETPHVLEGRQKLNGTGIQEADIFVQVVSATPPAGAAQLTIHATEQGTEVDQGYGADVIIGTVVANQGTTPWIVQRQKAGTGTPSSVAQTTAATTILAANTARKGATITNAATGNRTLFLLLSATGTPTASGPYTAPVAQGGYFEVPFDYTDVIQGIWSGAGTGTAQVTEFT